MARTLIGILLLALAVSVINALMSLLLTAAILIVGGLLLVFMYKYCRRAFWSAVLVGGIYILTRIGPWGLAFLSIWLALEAVSAVKTAKTRKARAYPRGHSTTRLLDDDRGGIA